MTTESITSNQRKQVVRFMEDGLDALRLDKDGAQRIIENGGEFQVGLKKLIEKYSISNQFADEEVESSYTYPNGYKPKGVATQVQALKSLFPELKDATCDESIATKPLPPNAEGWFAIPRWEKLGSSYGEAFERVLTTIKSKRTFYNYREGQTGQEYLRQHVKTEKAFQKLGDEQKGHDILIVPCQLGMRHRGRSVRRAREVMNAADRLAIKRYENSYPGEMVHADTKLLPRLQGETVEFGLGAFAVGCMLLTHPEREVKCENLHMDCAGDEFAPDADGDFSSAPIFSFDGGEVWFGAGGFGHANERYGSVSAFLPK